MSLRQAAQMALEALQMSIPKPRPADDDYAELGWKEHNAAIAALRAALAEPQRTWVGLTDAELAEFSDAKLGSYDLCLEVEAKLKEKNT